MQRPTSVTVFSVLNVVFAAWGMVGLLLTVVLFFIPPDSPNPMVRIMHESSFYRLWMMVGIPLGLLAALALLVSGIGLFLLKPWARRLTIGYSIYVLVWGVANLVVNMVFLIPAVMKQAQEQAGDEAAAQMGAAIGGAVGGTCGGCFGLIYPILLLIFMYRPNVIAAFQPPAGSPAP